MQKVNALELRHSLSRIIGKLEKNGAPILLEKGRKPAAVLISLADYKKRFVEKDADDERRELVQRILNMARPALDKKCAEDILRELRTEASS